MSSSNPNPLTTCTITESTLPLPSNGPPLYTKTWHPPPSAPTKARLIWLHGFSDHSNWYNTLFSAFAARGIACYAFDQRGWGRSVREKRERGLSGGTEVVVGDIGVFVRHVFDEAGDDAGVPCFLGGHSMGGAEALTFMATGPRELVGRIRGVVLEAPFLAQPPQTRASAVTVALGKAASRVLPGRQMVQRLEKRFMSRDAAVCEAWERDELCHDTGTLEGLRGLLERGADLVEGRVVVREGLGEGGKTRVWVGHGSGDAVADLGAVRSWFEGLKVGDKEMVVFEGGFHKLHCEPEGEGKRFERLVGDWIERRCGGLEGEAGVERPKL